MDRSTIALKVIFKNSKLHFYNQSQFNSVIKKEKWHGGRSADVKETLNGII